jgi:adenine-specific DNA-methyltransferase
MPTLNWIGKDKVINHAADVPYRVLEHKYTHGEDSGNMIIKGDNLAALKSLLPMYEGRIKCIYIEIKTPNLIQINFECANKKAA